MEPFTKPAIVVAPATMDRYLSAILALSRRAPVVRSVDVAAYIGCSKACVSVAVKQMIRDALIVRDETAAAVTPQATGALFFRPSPTPGPSPAPAAWPDSLGAVLAPEELLNALPGTVKSASPAEEFAAGRADAALLTPGQAARLPFGYRFYALPGGGGFVPIGANAYSEAGNAFVQYLLREDSQRALEAHGLFSPFLRLYGPDDPLRYRLDRERPGAEG